MKPGSNTPWGVADYVKQIARGISWVSTPSHGGFLIGSGAAKTYLTEQARKHGAVFGSYLAFEEDCDAAIVLYEHPELFDVLGLKNDPEYTPWHSLSFWNAGYLIERGIDPEPKAFEQFQQRKAERAASVSNGQKVSI
jgi:hypothetical protein